ncbi:hypothetical protein DCCM_4026 [Desulfocucumis palustris]|uniref:Uncharacterized protein n=1 Tax=Desulfocucumis palustris TaxID=1898651 RepID=A0A2L2XKU5_9FIRM|nr:hypothetical protein DCCM_4026 [Desulfocucumis palustris]
MRIHYSITPVPQTAIVITVRNAEKTINITFKTSLKGYMRLLLAIPYFLFYPSHFHPKKINGLKPS